MNRLINPSRRQEMHRRITANSIKSRREFVSRILFYCVCVCSTCEASHNAVDYTQLRLQVEMNIAFVVVRIALTHTAHTQTARARKYNFTAGKLLFFHPCHNAVTFSCDAGTQQPDMRLWSSTAPCNFRIEGCALCISTRR